MSKKQQRPTKDPFIKYYILWPIENVLESILDFFRWVWRTITGAWWCDHCETYHCRRVHKFLVKPNVVQLFLKSIDRYEDQYVCSLGRDKLLHQEQKTEPEQSVNAAPQDCTVYKEELTS